MKERTREGQGRLQPVEEDTGGDSCLRLIAALCFHFSWLLFLITFYYEFSLFLNKVRFRNLVEEDGITDVGKDTGGGFR